MKHKIIKPILAMLPVLAMGCTGNYLEINTNPYEVDKDQLLADDYAIMAAMQTMAGAVISPDVNTAQFTDCLIGGPCGGYYASSGSWGYSVCNFNAPDDWTNVFMQSSHIIPTLYTNIKEVESLTDDPLVTSIIKIVRVAAMHRVTDAHGPIPYSQIGQDGQIEVPYDSQQQVYDKMFEELDQAIAELTENSSASISAKADPIYSGEAVRWCRLANSLKLRLAMRIVYADPAKAQEMAESAVNHEIGVITSNDDNAKINFTGENGNPMYVAVKYNEPQECNTGGDTHAAADIISYMNGYEDPRRAKYFVESEWDDIEYVGMRRGIEIPSLNSVGRKYSGVNLTSTDVAYWINAAEVAFLRAEAAAVFNFNMGGSAGDFYNEGIRLSFQQWGVSGYDDYALDATLRPDSYTDPSGQDSYSSRLSDLTIAWDEGATTAQKQERIIIQKWIANYHLGNEAWADYRRTGYPVMIPATTAGNKSNGTVDSRLGARRMPYPQAEYTSNSQNVQQAVSQYLDGPDNMGTRLWWDCNPAVQ